MKALRFFVLLIPYFLGISALAQSERVNWYLGDATSLGVQFPLPNYVPNVTTGNAVPMGREGRFVGTHPISGNLLFYGNGTVLYDASGMTMTNGAGLSGNVGNFQSAWSVPNPANCDQYYYIYNSAVRENAPGGVFYSIIDMSAQGNGTPGNPLGEVVMAQKDVPIYQPSWEGFTVIQSVGNHAYWLLIGNGNGSSIEVFNISAGGVNFSSSFPLPAALGDIRTIRANRLGTQVFLVSGVESDPSYIIDFNPAIGALSNPIAIPAFGASNNFFDGNLDAEFSFDGTKVYVSKMRNPGAGSGGQIYQVDLSNLGNPPVIVYDNMGGNNDFVSGLRRGPNKQIYFVHREPTNGYRYLGVIQNPNAAGLACNPLSSGIDLGQGFNEEYFGLPNFFLENFKPVAITDSIIVPCNQGFAAQVSPLINDLDSNFTAFSLSLIDIPQGVQASINGTQVDVVFPNVFLNQDTIFYEVCDDHCFQKCDTGFIVLVPISNVPSPFWPNDTSLCASSPLPLFTPLANQGLLHTWSTGATTDTIFVSNTGDYSVEVNLGNCVIRDTIFVDIISIPTPNLGLNRLICSGIPPILDATCSGCSYLWSTGSTAGSIAPTQPGNYWVQVTSQCGVGSDTVAVTSSVQPFVELGPDRLVCDTADLFIDYSCLGCYYLVNDQAADSSLTIEASGTYWVEVGNDCGTVYDTVTLVMGANAEFNILDDSLVCPGDTAYLTSAGAVAPYTWSDGSTGDTLMITERGWYSLTWTGVCGETTDSVYIKQLLPSEITLGDDFTVCDSGFAPIYIENLGDDAEYLWWNGTTGDTAYVFREDNYVVRVDYCEDFYTDTIFVRYTDETDGLFIPNTFTPNGDGLNEIFYIRGLDPAWLSFEFLVFDRWGQIVYQTDDPRKGWEGLDPSGANKLDDGSYVYKVIYTSPCRSEWEYTGVVNMIR